MYSLYYDIMIIKDAWIILIFVAPTCSASIFIIEVTIVCTTVRAPACVWGSRLEIL